MKKIIIVGGGLSGLSSGIHALKKGFEVEIYEKNHQVGGCLCGWERNGFWIENCMHWLTGTNQKSKLFSLWKNIGAVDETTNLYQADSFYSSQDESGIVVLSKDIEKTRESLLQISSKDKKEIQSFLKAVSYCILMHQQNMPLHKYIPFLLSWQKYRKLSLGNLSERFKHPLLKKMITDYIPKEYSSLALIEAYATFASGDGKVDSEGSESFLKRIESKFIELGGKIYTDSEIVSIHLDQEKIVSLETKDHKTIMGDEIIFACDLQKTYQLLNDSKYYASEASEKLKIDSDYPTISSFQVAFEIEKKDLPFQDTLVIEIPSLEVAASFSNRLVLKEYSYLKQPFKIDNSNKTVLQGLIVQRKNDFDYWKALCNKDKKEYDKKKTMIAEEIRSRIIEQFPTTESSIKLLDSWTPYTYYQTNLLKDGSYMGFVYTKNTKKEDIPAKIPHLSNGFLATIWQYCTGGLPIAAEAGRKTIAQIKK